MRFEALPDIPPAGDFVRGYEASTWWAIGVRRGTPAGIIDKLNKEINAILTETEVKSRLADLGTAMVSGSPANFDKFVIAETEKAQSEPKISCIKLRRKLRRFSAAVATSREGHRHPISDPAVRHRPGRSIVSAELTCDVMRCDARATGLLRLSLAGACLITTSCGETLAMFSVRSVRRLLLYLWLSGLASMWCNRGRTSLPQRLRTTSARWTAATCTSDQSPPRNSRPLSKQVFGLTLPQESV